MEVGTGSGYQGAILARLIKHVFTVERIDELSRQARKRFRVAGLRNVRAKQADGHEGWPQNAPYGGILVTAATAKVPDALFAQLEEGGVLIAPVGQEGRQQLTKYVRHGDKLERIDLGAVVFVPLLPGLN